MYFDNSNTVGFGDSSPDGTLKVDIEGKVGATEYCDEDGNNCFDPVIMGGGDKKIFEFTSAGGGNTWYLGKVRASSGSDGYAHIEIYHSDDYGNLGASYQEIDINQRNGAFEGNSRYFGDINSIPNIPLGDLSGLDFRKVNPIINSSCLIKKSVAYWDKLFDGVEDYELWLKLWTQKKSFFNVPDVLVLHRIHRDSAFNAKGNNNKLGKLLELYK